MSAIVAIGSQNHNIMADMTPGKTMIDNLRLCGSKQTTEIWAPSFCTGGTVVQLDRIGIPKYTGTGIAGCVVYKIQI